MWKKFFDSISAYELYKLDTEALRELRNRLYESVKVVNIVLQIKEGEGHENNS